MKIGTKSVLYGAHCFFLHPWFVAAAWWQLFGFPWDLRLWVAFFVHDIGYWGKPNMDGDEGEEHPRTGAILMYKLFGHEWWKFCMYHSRFWAKRHNEKPSALCIADKLAICLTPRWLYLPMVNWTGEIEEYMKFAGKMNNLPPGLSQRAWHDGMVKYVRAWVEEHKDGKEDTWTKPKSKQTSDKNGVWT
jgi:hypothetical protein